MLFRSPRSRLFAVLRLPRSGSGRTRDFYSPVLFFIIVIDFLRQFIRHIQAAVVRADMAILAAGHVIRIAVPVAIALGLVIWACCRLQHRG